MHRFFRHRATLAFAALAALAVIAIAALPASARASDIACDAAAAPQAQRILCESALFSTGYERIFTEQQKLLKEGAITEAEIDTFRQRRDKCDTANCLDALFTEWRLRSSTLKNDAAAAKRADARAGEAAIAAIDAGTSPSHPVLSRLLASPLLFGLLAALFFGFAERLKRTRVKGAPDTHVANGRHDGLRRAVVFVLYALAVAMLIVGAFAAR